MISKKLAKLLNTQIGHELQASQEYLAVSIYFHMENLDGWGSFFRRQSEEERFHAMKIVDFLISVGAEPNVPALSEVKVKFKNALEPVQQALDWEKQVTRQFHNMAQIATDDRDYTTLQFLQWFITEQIEEENTMDKLVSIVKSGINLFQAELILPQPEGHE